MKLLRRNFLRLTAGAGALPVVSRFAWAQAYPTRPVRWIVGFPAGGGSDVLARLLGQWLSERLGQPFVIENRPGAGTNIATEAVVRAPPDGYTLLQASAPAAINATLYDKLNFNFIRDIAPVEVKRIRHGRPREEEQSQATRLMAIGFGEGVQLWHSPDGHGHASVWPAPNFLKAVYMDAKLPLSVRMRAAIEVLPFTHPKLAVVAQVSENDFATLLDRRLKRIEQMEMKVIEAKAVPPQTIEVKPPMPRLADRRYRRM